MTVDKNNPDLNFCQNLSSLDVKAEETAAVYEVGSSGKSSVTSSCSPIAHSLFRVSLSAQRLTGCM